MFIKTQENLDKKKIIFLRTTAIVEEADKLRKMTNTTSNNAMLRALINEKLYPGAKVDA